MKKLLFVFVALALLASCSSTSTDTGAADGGEEKVSLTAAGATFPMPFYNMVFKQYTQDNGILVTYGGIGSGGGIRSLKDKVVDFGATDAYLNDEKLKDMPAEIVHIPTCLGAVVIAYNLEGVEGIKLTNELLEGIFMGKITKWNDPKIKENNNELELPAKDITVIHRSDGSGTTHIFSDFMSKISETWKNEVGTGKSLKWPCGMGAKGNPGVSGTIRQTDGAIGYIGSEYALAQNIPVAKIKNKAGNYIEPSIESISAAASGEIPADTRVMLTNSDAADAYPISGFTWIILYKEQSYDNRSKAKAEATLNFLKWLIDSDAQAVTSKVNYSPLPAKAVSLSLDILKSITYNGETILK